MDVGHLTRYADLVAVEVVGLLAVFAFFIGTVVYLCQRFVAVGIGVDIGIPAVRVDFLKQTAAVPNEVGAFEWQSVHCEFVGGFGTESVDVGGQSVEAVVFEGFVTAVGVVG